VLCTRIHRRTRSTAMLSERPKPIARQVVLLQSIEKSRAFARHSRAPTVKAVNRYSLRSLPLQWRAPLSDYALRTNPPTRHQHHVGRLEPQAVSRHPRANRQFRK
jgi:hypothetical protein